MLSVPQTPTEDPEIAVDPAFGERVRQARRARGWNQTELARAVVPAVSQATISLIERGQGQSSAVLSICRVLGIDPPVVGQPTELTRWIEVGRALARFPEVFGYHLGALEAVVAALSTGREANDADRGASARH